MKSKSYEKLFLIYTFVNLGESNAKMFHHIMGNKESAMCLFNNYSFAEHTTEENNKYLLKWKRDNHIILKEWGAVDLFSSNLAKEYKEDDNGVPIFVWRKN